MDIATLVSELNAILIPRSPGARMQENLPLRLAEFARVRDGFIAFQKLPAGTPFNAVIPEPVVEAMALAARRDAKRRRLLELVRASSVIAGIAGGIAILAIDPTAIGIAAMLASGTAFVWAHRRTKVRTEPEIDQLAAESDEELRRNLFALEEYRILLGSGEIPSQEHLPDGTIKSISGAACAAYHADHGTLLIVSRDQALWECIPHRPIPLGTIWAKIGNHVVTSRITARTILETREETHFNQRTEWLLSAADQKSRHAASFRMDVCILIELRKMKAEGKTLDECKEALAKEGYGRTRVAHMNAGIYVPFEKFLATLPLRDFP